MKTHVTISISMHLAERITRFSKRHDIPKSQIHAMAIEAWLEQFEEERNSVKGGRQ